MINRAAEYGPAIHRWWKDWRGQTAAVVASGPSAKHAGVELLKDKMHVIAVNESFKLAPFADVLYGCDLAWWQLHKGAPQFTSLKLTHEPCVAQHYPSVNKIQIENVALDRLLIEHPGKIGSGGNGGFQALNLLVQFGIKRIVLVGIDCHLENGAHWHGRHPSPMNNPAQSNVDRWRAAFNGNTDIILGLGIEVVNCSPTSTVHVFPKATIAETLERWRL